MKRIGLLGGSFDPVHVAHIAVANAAQAELDLAQLQLIPAAHPWQRSPLQASPQQRLDMLALAIAAHPGLAINPLEIKRGGTTYTVDTLHALPQDQSYVWLLGADQLQNFCTWKNWRDIALSVDLAVVARPGSQLTVPTELADWLNRHQRHLQDLPFSPMAISASDIRLRLSQGRSTAGLLDPAVADYIATHQLYR